ncbi:MAG: NAD-dependent epimerase/dehydratase family protein [Salinibacter sp.]
MTRVAVTGGSGQTGRHVVEHCRDHGYEVVNVDRTPPESFRPTDYVRADLTDLGQTFEALDGVDAVVHLTTVSTPIVRADSAAFRANLDATYNVFAAATQLNLDRVVWASSETVFGVPFVEARLAYAPVDDEHPLYPESGYALAKVLSEELARQFSRRSGRPFIGLRLSNVIPPDGYDAFASFQADPHARKWNLWGYVDARDVAQACRLALEADGVEGAETCIVAAADTLMDRPSRELMAEVFPKVPVGETVTRYGTLLDITKAQALLGYVPQHSWREVA